MCEKASFLVSTEGPLQCYFAPGLRSHAAAREGWGMTSEGAEAEWKGESHDSLVVRHEDKDVARTIKQMIVERYPTRSTLLSTITETRGLNGFRVSYVGGHPIVPADGVWRMDLDVDDDDAQDFVSLASVTGDVIVDGTFTAPALTSVTGDIYVYNSGTFQPFAYFS